MKKRLRLKKVTLKTLTDEQVSTIVGGFVSVGGKIQCAPTEVSCVDTCSGTCYPCVTGATCDQYTCENTCNLTCLDTCAAGCGDTSSTCSGQNTCNATCGATCNTCAGSTCPGFATC